MGVLKTLAPSTLSCLFPNFGVTGYNSVQLGTTQEQLVSANKYMTTEYENYIYTPIIDHNHSHSLHKIFADS